MEEKCAQIWSKLATALKPQVSADTYKRWFSAVKLVHATDDALTLLVPNNIYQFWIESNHMAALQSAVVTAFGAPRTIKFSMPSDGTVPLTELTEEADEPTEAPPETTRSAKNIGSALGLNPRNNFESFVVGQRSGSDRPVDDVPWTFGVKSWNSDGARNPVPHDARTSNERVGCQRRLTFGLVVLPKSL